MLPNPQICGPLPLVAALGVFVPPPPKNSNGTKCYIQQDTKAWLSHSDITYSFLDDKPGPEDWQLDPVERAIAEYTNYANVNLIRKEDADKSANIRISFKVDYGSWSAIGIDALKIVEGPTMNLGFLSRKPSDPGEPEGFYNLTLHQFGHAFGLAHEWDASWGTLNEGDGEGIKQHKAAFGQCGTSNFKEPDKTSIMKLLLPSDEHVLNGLSKKDKAWLTLIYPGKAGGDSGDEDTGILHSLNDLDVPLDVSSRILLGSTVSEMRFHYQKFISEKWGDKLSMQAIKDAIPGANAQLDDSNSKPEPHVLQGKISGITPLVDQNSEDDLYDAVAAAVLDPQFSQILANVVNQDDDNKSGAQPENGILNKWQLQSPPFFSMPPYMLSGINPQAPPDVQNSISSILSALGGLLPLIFAGLPPSAAPGNYPQALPPNIEQGIFSTLAKFMTHPTFINIIKDIVADAPPPHGAQNSGQKSTTK